MLRKISFETRIAIGSTIFAVASSALLYCIPPSPAAGNHLRGAFIPYFGFAYLTVVKYPIAKIDTARLYENDVPLHRAGDLQDIVSKGSGSYKVYINAGETIPSLMFSSSDNTDPNTNGRKYRLE